MWGSFRGVRVSLAKWTNREIQTKADAGVSAALSPHQPALARPAAQYASRLVESGIPLAQVHDLLGHASITTTERYDNQKLENLQAAVLKLEKENVRHERSARAKSAR